jgi:hypothetical protein
MDPKLILAAMAADLERRTAWDEAPALYAVVDRGDEPPHLEDLDVPEHLWDLASPGTVLALLAPQFRVGMLAHKLAAVGLRYEAFVLDPARNPEHAAVAQARLAGLPVPPTSEVPGRAEQRIWTAVLPGGDVLHVSVDRNPDGTSAPAACRHKRPGEPGLEGSVIDGLRTLLARSL